MAPGRLNIRATFNKATEPQALHRPRVGVIISQSRQRLASCKGTKLEPDGFICVPPIILWGRFAVGETEQLTLQRLPPQKAPVHKGHRPIQEIQGPLPDRNHVVMAQRYFTTRGHRRVLGRSRLARDGYYFPIQNVLKMRLRMSSVVVAPVISSRGRSAL
jgi:hypothetical protein